MHNEIMGPPCVAPSQIFRCASGVVNLVLSLRVLGTRYLAVERERGPIMSHALIGAGVLRRPHLGKHDAVTAVLLVTGPG